MLFERPSLGPASFSRGEPGALGDVFDAAFEAGLTSGNINARERQTEEAYDRRIDAIEAALGQRLENPYRMGSVSPGAFGEPVDDPFESFQASLRMLAEQHPDQREVIRADRSPLEDAREAARTAEGRLGEVMGRTPGLAKYGALLAGGLNAGVYDPINLATMAIGPTGTVGAGARQVLWMGVKQGAANAGVELAAQPVIAQWRREAGLEYGASDLALGVGSAFLLGFGLDAGIRGASRGLGLTSGNNFAPGLSELRTLNAQKAQVLDDAAKLETAPEIVRKAAAGDRVALEEVAAAAGVADEPAMRGARQALDIEDLPARVEGIDDGEGIAALAAALRHAGDPEAHPPPVRPDPVPAPRSAILADDAPSPGRLFEIEGKPVAFREIDPARVVTDAATFQFKAGGDSQGATGRLGGVERWDPIAAGRAVLYERASGEMVIADGHQRLALARRLADQAPQLQAFVFREADGWTPGDVRALAAKKNLQEGSGSVVDAAAIMRERPDIIDKSVPLGSEAMRQARSLARLSDEAFGMVVGGVLPANYAALVGDLVADKSRHAGLVQELAGIDPANAREARFAVSELMQLPVHVEEQMTLLGAFRVERSLMKERVGVLDAALKALKADARVFALLDREAGRIEAAGNVLDEAANAARASEAEQVAALIEQLAATRGPVSDWLNDAARAVASGFSKRQAAAAFARRVADTLEADGLRGLTSAEPPPLRAGGFDEPGGPAAKRQTELLEQQLAREIEAATKPDKAGERQAVLFDLAARVSAALPAKTGRRLRARTFHGNVFEEPDFDAMRGSSEVWSTSSRSNASQYGVGGYVVPMDIDFRNPLVVNARKGTLFDSVPFEGDVLDIRDVARIARERGHDGMVVRKIRDVPIGDGEIADTYVALRPGTVRSALTGELLLDVSPASAEPYRPTPRVAAEQAAIRRELVKTLTMLPDDVQLRVRDRLVFKDIGEAQGLWDGYDRVVWVSLAAADPVRTARHEVVHALRQSGLMTDAEFDTLYRFAERFDLRKAYGIDGTYGAAYKKAYGDRGDDYVESLLREETVANLFADYSLNGRRFGQLDGGRMIDALLDMITQFLARVRNALDGLGFRDVRDVFEAIESGAVARRALANELDGVAHMGDVKDVVEACK